MAGYRSALSVCLLLALSSLAWSQPATSAPSVTSAQACKPAEASTPVTKVYALSDLGDDPHLGKWIAETIPQMIQPGSWSNAEGKKSLSYYAPGKVLVVCHTPAVHAQVDEFMQGLRKAMPTRVRHDGQVVPAQFTPDAPRVGPVAAQPYPIPHPMHAPKHLFHFIIRYEGEGIIDSNVTKFAKTLTGASQAEKPSTLSYAPPAAPITNVLPASGTTLPPSQDLNTPPQYMAPANAPRMPPADAPQEAAPAPLPPSSPAVVPVPLEPWRAR
jgi:hypothetical protein